MWPQVTPRPLKFAYTLAEPFTLNINSEFAALMALIDRGAPGRVRRPCVAQPGPEDLGRQPRRSPVPRWDTYEVDESPAHPELAGRRLVDVAAERGAEPFDTMLDLALDEPDLALRVALRPGQRRRRRASPSLLGEEHCTLGLSDAGAHVGQLCDAPQATDFLGNWVRDRDLMPIEAGRPQAHGRPGRPARLRRPRATCARAPGPMWSSSTRRRSRPGPIRRVARLPGRRRAPDRRPADRRPPRRRQRDADPGRRRTDGCRVGRRRRAPRPGRPEPTAQLIGRHSEVLGTLNRLLRRSVPRTMRRWGEKWSSWCSAAAAGPS